MAKKKEREIIEYGWPEGMAPPTGLSPNNPYLRGPEHSRYPDNESFDSTAKFLWTVLCLSHRDKAKLWELFQNPKVLESTDKKIAKATDNFIDLVREVREAMTVLDRFKVLDGGKKE